MKQKIFLSLFLILQMASFAQSYNAGTFNYIVTSPNTVSIKGAYINNGELYCPTGDFTVPETFTYNGTTYNVTSIADYGFEHCSSLTSVILSNSITSIRGDAFYGILV